MEILIVIWLHFLADFIMQSNKMALNKSSSFKYLGLHGLVYSIPFLYFGFTFAIITGILHFIIDGITSRITSYFWKKENRHWFFVTIGFDQAVHMSCLILLLKYI